MYKIETLTNNHAVENFDCGDERKNNFLKKFALQNNKGGLGRTYVAVKPPNPKLIFGYYTISSGTVMFENIPKAKHLPRYPIPSILIGKLAVDVSTQGHGLGTVLLFDALKRAALTSEQIGVFLVEIEAVDEKAKEFYVKKGFLEMVDSPLKLFMKLKTVRKLLEE